MLLVIPSVQSVNSLGQVPVSHYWIIGQHSGPSLSPLLLPRERWKSYWSCVWISDQSPPNQPPGMREGKQVTKDISMTMYILITTVGWRRVQHHNNNLARLFSLNSQAKWESYIRLRTVWSGALFARWSCPDSPGDISGREACCGFL